MGHLLARHQIYHSFSNHEILILMDRGSSKVMYHAIFLFLQPIFFQKL